MLKRIQRQHVLQGAIALLSVVLIVTAIWQGRSKPAIAAAKSASQAAQGQKPEGKPATVAKSSRLLESFNNGSDGAKSAWVADSSNTAQSEAGSAWSSRGAAQLAGGTEESGPQATHDNAQSSGASDARTGASGDDDGSAWAGSTAAAETPETPTRLQEELTRGDASGSGAAAGGAGLAARNPYEVEASPAPAEAPRKFAEATESPFSTERRTADNPLRNAQRHVAEGGLASSDPGASGESPRSALVRERFPAGGRESAAMRGGLGAAANPNADLASGGSRLHGGSASPATRPSKFDAFAEDAPPRHAIAGAVPLRQALDTQRQFAGATGLGEPGQRQLEGPQTPSLSIVKVAPPEIQIGKPAVFQIRVRNTSQIPAANVRIHDTVPRGTQFLSSNPPAQPTPTGELLWSIGDLRPGEEQVVKMDLMPVAEGEIGSVARVTFTAEASARTIATRPELKLEVIGPREVLIGQDVNLRIKVWNPGTGPATGIVLSEQIPEGLQHPQGPVLEYEVGDLRPNQSKELELTMQAAKAGVVENILQARGDGNLTAEARTELQVVAPGLEVAIHGPQRRYLDRPANFTVSVANPGTAPARDIELVTYLPKGMKFVKADGFGQYDPRSNAVYWSLEELPPSQRGTVTLSLLPAEQGEHTLAVEGTARMNLFHRQEHLVAVEGVAAMLFEVKDLADPIDVGGATTFQIKVENQGSKAATNVEVVVELPPELRPVSADGPVRYAVQGNQLVFGALPRLAPRAEVIYEVRAQGVRPGDARLRVRLSTAELTAPVTREESTRVFSDE